MIKKISKAIIFGTFDVIHPGHISIFNYTRKLADKLSIIIARDKNIEKQTLFNEQERLANIQKLAIAEQVCLGSLNNPLEFYKKIKPDLVILGYDQTKYVDLLKKINITIKRAPVFHPELFKSNKLNKIINDQQAHFYLINKNTGSTSFNIISTLRKTLNLKKIGFAGTLDPMASGLMILASGKATKFLDSFHLLNKIYEAQIELNKTSDTFDAEGIIKNKKVNKKPGKEEIIKLLEKKFTGIILQTPPIFSAKKINGQKAYNLARKNQEVKLKPVKITVNEIQVLKYNYPFLDLKINCSKGTYIRSIANDLGKELKTGGVLVKLKRTAIGPFDLKNALAQEKINLKNLEKNKLSILEIVKKMNYYFLK